MRTLIFFALTIMLSGCVGISAIKTTKTDKHIELSPYVGYLYCCDDNNYAKSDVISLWGEPDEILIEKNAQHWIYNRERAFNGLIFWAVLIPIPLVIPTGYRTTRLIFEEDTISKIIYEDTKLPTISCGFPNIFENDAPCGFWD